LKNINFLASTSLITSAAQMIPERGRGAPSISTPRRRISRSAGYLNQVAMPNEVPMRGEGTPMPPTDPLIYRFYELVMVNGPAWKALIEEEYGDGIMSAIDFDMVMERLPNPKGDRVKITMSGKFLPYKYYGASGNVPEYGFKEG
jgi:hypothetical protein